MVAKTRYIAYVATSIDGRIAKNSHSAVDWTSSEDWNFFQKSLSKIDACIVGYHTYKTVEDRLKRRNTIVLTSKKLKSSGSVIFFNPEKHNLKNFLADRGFKKVAILGGAQVYYFCLLHKMIDELFVTIEPYVFTAGVPMFQGDVFKKYKFSLKSIKKLNKKGTILLHYTYGD